MPGTLQANCDIGTIGTILGHADVRMTMMYTHCVSSKNMKELTNPFDFWTFVSHENNNKSGMFFAFMINTAIMLIS